MKLFVSHKSECNSDIKHGLSFSGTELGKLHCHLLINKLFSDFAAGNELESTLSWQLNPTEVHVEKPPAPIETPQLAEPPQPPPPQPAKTETEIEQPGSIEKSSMEDVVVYGSNCPVCGKSFATKNNCRRHVREMHGMNPISKPRVTQEQCTTF